MDEQKQIEDILMGIDFSKGHKEVVWEKVSSRIPLLQRGLGLDELDDVAGGLSATPKPERWAKEKL